MKLRVLLPAAAIILAMLMTGCQGKDNKETSSAASSKAESSVASTASEESKEEKTESSEESSEPEESVTAGTPVDTEWFNDAEFIGDSVTLKLSYYAENGSLGDAAFLCAGSLGYNNSLMGIDEEGNVHPVYNGTQYTVFDGTKTIAPKKLIIMLGMNDIGLYGVDGAIDGMKTVTTRLAEENPDTVIYIQSVTPMLENMQLTDLNNTTIKEFDEKLKEVCAEKGFKYLDVYSAVEDGSGNLVPEYCGDPEAMGLHFSDEGCAKWVEYLKNHVND